MANAGRYHSLTDQSEEGCWNMTKNTVISVIQMSSLFCINSCLSCVSLCDGTTSFRDYLERVYRKLPYLEPRLKGWKIFSIVVQIFHLGVSIVT